eukprot:TRINITY_DN1420_c0_g1_i8.p1 TRINITY_DN1420_c0_g1~~TRINITY_DN1420_c0_g1_i8.p1  ORF type:complete len:929 (-),score=201.79 TRINITY_DN1420_c0_g1_i8:61-2847(-)
MLSKIIGRGLHSFKQIKSPAFKTLKYFCSANSSPDAMYEHVWGNLAAEGQDSMYAAQMLDSWIQNPKSVHHSWDVYFTSLLNQAPQEFSEKIDSIRDRPGQEETYKEIRDTMKILSLFRAFLHRAHEIAQWDPLNLKKTEAQSGVKTAESPPELDYKYFGFTEADLDRQFILRTELTSGFTRQKDVWTLREVYNNLKHYFSEEISYELAHINNIEEQYWLRNKISEIQDIPRTKEEKIRTFKTLSDSEAFTEFCKSKFSTTKRFGIEGVDVGISALDTLAHKSAVTYGVKNIVIGMPHRGRLNTLAIVFEKPLDELLAEFQDNVKELEEKDSWGSTGDVKYHLGTWREREYDNGHKLRLSILANPSHLEAVDPVVLGFVKAQQNFLQDENKEKCVPVVIHGDAAFAGQGIVYETLQFQDLKQYSVGGTIHVVFNNQIGFTTVPRQSRSGIHCTDIMKTTDSPVIHVNADFPELVDKAFELALDYRMKFQKDVAINVVGYRRFGHNELDQPSFTQPLMYSIIQQKKPVYQLYAEKLIKEGTLTEQEVQDIWKQYNQKLEVAYEQSRKKKIDYSKWRSVSWTNISIKKGEAYYQGVNLDLLRQIGEKITSIPEDITPHKQIEKIFQLRKQSISEGVGIDFGTAESLAWATLLIDGYKIRLSGQDVERGTFSHRHAYVFDQNSERKIMPIRNILPSEMVSNITVSNSHLSEYGVLGFEYGYSISDPNTLVMWEAQFGDFANEAQIIIDNFLVSGESKWGIPTALTLLLPHGFDGQGPEHSSARLERFLQLVDDDPIADSKKQVRKFQITNSNIQVCSPSTAANYFHLLRRQIRGDIRKPLIVMSPKRLLRFKGATSRLEDFKEGIRFTRVYPELYENQLVAPEKIRNVVLCNGQLYYDLLEGRDAKKVNDVALLRIEQLAPFPYELSLIHI